jgi:hypothetical protein
MVELLDVNGRPESLFGIVMGFDKRGRVKVYWSTGMWYEDAAWEWGRLRLVT